MFKLINDVAEVGGRGEVGEDDGGEGEGMEGFGLTRSTPAPPDVM